MNGLINLLAKNQISSLAAAAGAYIIGHGAGAGYNAADIDGSLVCLGAIALQALENYLSKRPAA